MLCSIFLAQRGYEVTVLEQNEKLGKKLFITGKGRCNITNDCTEEAFFDHVVTNPKFLYGAYHAYSAQDMIHTLNDFGLATKTERGNRVFPVSDHASDVIDTLKNKMKETGVKVLLNTPVKEIITNVDMDKGIRLVSGVRTPKGVFEADRVIIAAGGLTYPATGATGDGFAFARRLGLEVTDCSPSLVEILLDDPFTKDLEGLTLKNVTLSVSARKKTVFSEFGEMLFTRNGISGPIVLSASSIAGPLIGTTDLEAHIDLKPAISDETLDQHILRLFAENENKGVQNAIRALYPASLVPVIISVSGIDPMKKVHDITKEERLALLHATKNFPIHLRELGGFEEAVITKGGVSVKEVNPKTMESKKIKGLYFTGEVLDVDALTGGFNLQIAWSTAYVAGNA